MEAESANYIIRTAIRSEAYEFVAQEGWGNMWLLKQITKVRLLLRATAVLASSIVLSPAQATLIDNGNGTVTDTDRGIMWLKNANLSGTPMNLLDSLAWADNLVFAGYDDWRLPSALNPDGSGPCAGPDCTGSEIGHLYYDELLNVAGFSLTKNPGPFENIDVVPTAPAYSRYWLSPYPGCCGGTMFVFYDGSQGGNDQNQLAYAWAVRSVPLPPIIWLFGAGLVAIYMTRKAHMAKEAL